MDPRRNDDNRGTIDYPQYDEYDDQEYTRRFSLHSVGGANPMMGESMDFNYAQMNQEDSGIYFNRPSDVNPNMMRGYQMMNNYVHDYRPNEDTYNYQMLMHQRSDNNEKKGKLAVAISIPISI